MPSLPAFKKNYVRYGLCILVGACCLVLLQERFYLSATGYYEGLVSSMLHSPPSEDVSGAVRKGLVLVQNDNVLRRSPRSQVVENDTRQQAHHLELKSLQERIELTESPETPSIRSSSVPEEERMVDATATPASTTQTQAPEEPQAPSAQLDEEILQLVKSHNLQHLDEEVLTAAKAGLSITHSTKEAVAQEICSLPDFTEIATEFIHGYYDQVTVEDSDNIFTEVSYDGSLVYVDCDGPFFYRGRNDNNWRQGAKGEVVDFLDDYMYFECGGEQNGVLRPPYPLTKLEMQKRKPKKLFKDLEGEPLVDNVILIYIDAVSRSHFASQFPETLNFLRSLAADQENITRSAIGKDFASYEFHRHTVSGQNSVPNYGTLFSGLDGELFEQRQWDKIRAQNGTWVFDVFEALGFDTLYVDDVAGGYPDPESWSSYYAGANTNYGYTHNQSPAYWAIPQDFFSIKSWHWPGCKFQDIIPTKYGRTKVYERERNGTRETKTVPVYMGNNDMCHAQYPPYRHALEYMKSFFRTHVGRKKFTFSVLSDAHEPSQNLLSMDKYILQMLHEILAVRKSNALFPYNTAVIVSSDHGIHYGDEFTDARGFLHHKNPFVFTILPRALTEENPDFHAALVHNQMALTTQYDLHSTLLHLGFGKEYVSSSESPTPAEKHGRSLLVPVAYNRSCEEAHVRPGYCPCGMETTCEGLNTTSLVESLVDSFNDRIDEAFSAVGLQKPCGLFYPSDFSVTRCLQPAKSQGAKTSVATLTFWQSHLEKQYQAVFHSYGAGNDSFTLAEVSQDTTYGPDWEVCQKKVKNAFRSSDSTDDSTALKSNTEILARLHDIKGFCYCSGTTTALTPAPTTDPALYPGFKSVDKAAEDTTLDSTSSLIGAAEEEDTIEAEPSRDQSISLLTL